MSNWKKIIFLDIDGVMASIPYLCKGKGFIDPAKCRLLNTLEDIGAEIVISSSWGYDGGRTEESLRACGLTLPIIGYTCTVLHHEYPWACRGNEINQWLLKRFGGMGTNYYGLDDHGIPWYRNKDEDKDYEYVIFDDDQDMLYGQKDNFVYVNRYKALTKRHINKARKILMRQ